MSRARLSFSPSGEIARITISAGKGNILDLAAVAELAAAFETAGGEIRCKAVVLDADGPHFSFGASVSEHRRDSAPRLLATFHALLVQILELPLPVAVAVRGQCLGGGLELALAGSRIVVHPDAALGQPEIKLGVIAPAGSALLPLRLAPRACEELLVSGRTVDALEALRIGLVDQVTRLDEEPSEVAVAWAEKAVSALSASSLRFAVRAARLAGVGDAVRALRTAEKLYVEELMDTPDALEGIESFLAKRPPRWQGRAVPA